MNAKSIRPAAATEDSPQKAIATAMPAAEQVPEEVAEVVDEDADDRDTAAEVVLAVVAGSSSDAGNSVDRFGVWSVSAIRKM